MLSTSRDTYSTLLHSPEEAHACVNDLWKKLKIAHYEKPYKLVCSPYKETRSIQQNRRYWAILKHIAEQAPAHMDGVYLPPDPMWHSYFRQRFLGHDAIEIYGQVTHVLNSSRQLHVGPFNDYMTEVEAWAAEEGIHLG